MKSAVVFILLLLVIVSRQSEVFGQTESSDSTERRIDQNTNEVTLIEKKEEATISLLVYGRFIHNTSGAVRFDQNVVPNFKLNNLLRLELGFRQGETSASLGSYNHYKIELQTKYFYKKFRVIARLSDRISRFPSAYSNSNYLSVAEGVFAIGKVFTMHLAAGYVFTFQKDNRPEAWPITKGDAMNFPTYKASLRYHFNQKGFFEVVYGAYDVFNPYPVSAPFTQLSFDHYLFSRCTLYSYARYQFNKSIDTPLNEFLCVGLKFRVQ